MQNFASKIAVAVGLSCALVTGILAVPSQGQSKFYVADPIGPGYYQVTLRTSD